MGRQHRTDDNSTRAEVDAANSADSIEIGIASVFAAIHAESNEADEPDAAPSDEATFALLGELNRIWASTAE